MLAAIAGSAVCLVAMAFLQPGTPLVLTLALLLFSGIFRSVGFTAYNSVAFADVEPARMTGANTLMSTLQELGAGLGVAVGALLVRLGEAVGPHDASWPYRAAFVLLAVLLLGPAAEGLALHRRTGDAITGRA
jgi:MFS family permease